MVSFLLGSFAGMSSWLLVYPVDLIKTKVQRDALAGMPRVSAAEVFRQMLFTQGGSGDMEKTPRSLRRVPLRRFLRLYNGLGISALRSFLSHGITWMIIEGVSRKIKEPQRFDDDAPLFDLAEYQ